MVRLVGTGHDRSDVYHGPSSLPENAHRDQLDLSRRDDRSQAVKKHHGRDSARKSEAAVSAPLTDHPPFSPALSSSQPIGPSNTDRLRGVHSLPYPLTRCLQHEVVKLALSLH